MMRQLTLCLMLSFLVASCSPDAPPSSDHSSTPLTSTKSPGKSAAVANSDMPVPPTGAQYTIYCQRIVGPDHVEQSRALKQSLQAATSMKDWYVVHASDQSVVYYGFYRCMDPRDEKDGAEGQRAIHDLDTIRAMRDTNNFRPFSMSLLVPIDSPDPAAEPAWDLTRSGGYWSLEIAVYKGSPDRKEAAVESVRDMRAHGIEAYYCHLPNASGVYIGSWPREAAKEIDVAQQNVDPNAPLVVTSNPMSEAMQQQYEKNGIQTAAPQIQIVDPTMLEAMRRFPEHALNGYVYSNKPTASFLVKVPHRDPSDDEIAPSENSTPAAGMQNGSDDRSGLGKLKSIGE